MMKMIKPCPFCGRDVKLRQDGYYMAPVIRHVTAGPECVFRALVMYGMDMDTALTLWNRRAEDDRWRDDGR